MIKFDILTIFPEVFKEYFSISIINRARKKKLVKINIHNLRDYTFDRHRTVDDRPYGGGAGMIMKVEPIYLALKNLTRNFKKDSKRKIILLRPSKKIFNQNIARSYKNLKHIILICGHYEGIDERVECFVDESLSIGNFVLTGGELAAMIVVDATARLIKGSIRKESLSEESFEDKNCSKIEYPQYTRPEIFSPKKGKKCKVPEVLLSGRHEDIKQWREKHKSCPKNGYCKKRDFVVK